MLPLRRQSQNLISGDEVFGTGEWTCSSIPMPDHPSVCTNPTSTPWGSCNGNCLYIEQEGFPAFFPVATRIVDITSIKANGGAFYLSYDVLAVWSPNGTAPIDPPAASIGFNTELALANTNQDILIPLYTRGSSSGSFSHFFWHGQLDNNNQANDQSDLLLSLDHAPEGNGWYSIWLDNIYLGTTNPEPVSTTTSISSQSTLTTLPGGSVVVIGSSSTITILAGSNQTVSQTHSQTASNSTIVPSSTTNPLASSSTLHSTVGQVSSTVHSVSAHHNTILIAILSAIIILGLLAASLGLFLLWRRRRKRTTEANAVTPLMTVSSQIRRNSSSIFHDDSPLSPLYSKQPFSPISVDLPPAYVPTGQAHPRNVVLPPVKR